MSLIYQHHAPEHSNCISRDCWHSVIGKVLNVIHLIKIWDSGLGTRLDMVWDGGLGTRLDMVWDGGLGTRLDMVWDGGLGTRLDVV